jgi:hypothetical protein
MSDVKGLHGVGQGPDDQGLLVDISIGGNAACASTVNRQWINGPMSEGEVNLPAGSGD